MQGFATQQDFQDALAVFIGEFTGINKRGVQQVVLASVNVLSFGAGLATTNLQLKGMMHAGTPTEGMSAADAEKACRQALESLQNSGGSIGAGFDWSSLPWGQILSLALSFLKKYVPWLPVPALPEPPTPNNAPVKPALGQ